MDVSVIIPIYNPDKKILKKVLHSLKKQDFKDKIEVIKIQKNLGLAESMNFGIKKAKYETIVTLHQDCIPSSKDWLERLVEPLKKEDVVAACSDVYDIELKKKYTPKLDEKGCAYKKKLLEKVGFFDNALFLNSGEDYDMYMKLKKIGKIAYPHSLVRHNHPGYLNAIGYKRLQNANTWGCLFRVYGVSLPNWWKPLIKANILNPRYFYWFWRGFIKKKQDFKR